jgi:aspartokinase
MSLNQVIVVPADPQATDRLKAALTRALETADEQAAQNLTDAMMFIAQREHHPTRQQLADFANALTGAEVGKTISDSQESLVGRCIVGVLRGEKTSNFALAALLRDTLTLLRTDDTKTDLLVRRFIAIGEAVRGPDDQGLAPMVVVPKISK